MQDTACVPDAVQRVSDAPLIRDPGCFYCQETGVPGLQRILRTALRAGTSGQTFSTLRNGPRPGRYDFSSRNCFMPCCSRISLSFFVSESCFDLR